MERQTPQISFVHLSSFFAEYEPRPEGRDCISAECTGITYDDVMSLLAEQDPTAFFRCLRYLPALDRDVLLAHFAIRKSQRQLSFVLVPKVFPLVPIPSILD
jgi:hypothetical protein